MGLKISKLKPSDIPELNKKQVLYSLDFRGIGENLDYEIPEMRKYENLLPWILDKQTCLANEDSASLKYANKNTIVVVKSGNLAQTSIYERLGTFQKFKHLWVGIPHPSADKFIKNNNMSITYDWATFLKLNDKIKQKKIIKNNTPEYIIVRDFTHLSGILAKDNNFFLKRNIGSGGFTSFDCTKTNIRSFEKFSFKENNILCFYLERKVNGTPFSIQLYKHKTNIVAFGYTKQLVEDGHFFKGNEIFDLTAFEEIDFLINILKQAKTFLAHYNGFLGLDFLANENGAYFLEFNVRLTAATIPTLLTNALGWKKSIYLENEAKPTKTDLILTNNIADKKYDILRKVNG